jgi:predicted deacylase
MAKICPTGTSSQIFNYNFFNKIVKTFNFMIDLHTASFGRINSYYIRADLNDETSAIFAKLQQPQIILHSSGQDGTLRSAAANVGIKSITVEIGNPSIFQSQYVEWSYIGVMRVLTYLNMFREITIDLSPSPAPLTVLCSKGYWIYTKTGGLLEVYPKVNSIIKKGALIARIKNIFGNIVDEVYCPENGVNIGKSSNPVAMSGDRIIHLGVIKKSNEELAVEAKENY